MTRSAGERSLERQSAPYTALTSLKRTDVDRVFPAVYF